MKKISILGSTGSIGTQTLEIVEASNNKIQVVGLAAGKNIKLLRQQIKKFQPSIVSVSEQKSAEALKKDFPDLEIVYGEEGLSAVATAKDAEIVLVAIVGVVALKPTIEAIRNKKDIALASKEILVAAGKIIMDMVKQYGVKLLPVDSEHSAIMQSFPPQLNEKGYFEYPVDNIEKLILTASGGAFGNATLSELKKKTVSDALKHPNWSMGKKITIDSATLMNKGLEVIEAHWLFNVPFEQIDVVIHPQSIVHSLAEYIDGSVVAQLGVPDMRIPIQYALNYPQRAPATWPKLKLAEIAELTFKEPDRKKYKALDLAYNAGKIGGTLPAVLNAANETAVSLFLEEKIGFLDIAELVNAVMEVHEVIQEPMLSQIIAADLWARETVLKESTKYANARK